MQPLVAQPLVAQPLVAQPLVAQPLPVQPLPVQPLDNHRTEEMNFFQQSWHQEQTFEGMVLWLQHQIPAEYYASAVVKYFLTTEYVFHFNLDLVHLIPKIFTNVNANDFISVISAHLLFSVTVPIGDYLGTPFAYSTSDAIGTRVEHLLTTIRLFSETWTRLNRIQDAFTTRTHASLLEEALPTNEERDRSDLKPTQVLLEYYFDSAQQSRLRRFKTAFYAPVLTTDGQNSRFYTHYQDQSDFIYKVVTPMELHPVVYDALTLKPGTPAHMINLLEKIPDIRCPMLHRQRSFFSFDNGIFDAATCTLHSFRPSNAIPDHTEIDTTTTSANYFACAIPTHYMDEALDPMDIPTPFFDSILVTQKFTASMKFWMFVMCGRLFHDVRTLDDWQVALFIRGVAGSGKSTILKLLSYIYQRNDVGIMMSDGQSTFSDEHLVDKYIVLAMDLDKTTTFSQTRFNSFVSGEMVSINRKFKTALMQEWKAMLAMASNGPPPWHDVAGNMARRIMIFMFNVPVIHSDANLFEKCVQEVPHTIVKMARCYLKAVRAYGGRSLWERDILPPELHQSRNAYLVSCNPSSSFLQSDHVVMGVGFQEELTLFEAAMNRYMTEHRLGTRAPVRLSAAEHGPLFTAFKCEIVEGPDVSYVLGVKLCA